MVCFLPDQTFTLPTLCRSELNVGWPCATGQTGQVQMKQQILVIDDEESIRFTFSYLLEDLGYVVSTAASPNEALAAIENHDFDLIFLDLLLGIHSGLVTLETIKSRLPLTPVIMVTGAPDEDTVSKAISLGAFAYIPKPVRQETLQTITEEALAFRRKCPGQD
jgi:two-component system, NtrC family, response regulator HydG